MPPPDFPTLLENLRDDMPRMVKVLSTIGTTDDEEYLWWDKLRYKEPPEGLNHEEWWLGLKFKRRANMRQLPLEMIDGEPFAYSLPDKMLRELDYVSQRASGQIALPEEVVSKTSRDRYVIQSLIEEAISSSQLEGASTTRREAKRMLAYGEPPKDRSQQMILNNYRAMQRIREISNESFTPERICEIHRIVTEKTLNDPHSAGSIQSNPDPDDRVKILDEEDRLLHKPPPVEQLPDRLKRLCDFANAGIDSHPYVPPVVRALTIHFMMGYDHYFEDGNGRTARALFYWSMLKQGFWLTEHLAISLILKDAPAQYARSFILTEQDEGDLTYFFLYHLDVIRRALVALDKYLHRKTLELQRARSLLIGGPYGFNHRQVALVQSATRDPSNYYTAESHMNYHAVSKQTARNDLYDLERRGLLERTKIGKQFAWIPRRDMLEAPEDVASGS
ncbi:Fic family protein [Mycolicibacterium rutilum]|uniref:Fic family protein n=2 Tax=Mycolicibacterium rutilum TaxID=370526 RepID=A0A1H6IJ49_MYCRU|nr:Fic family protein [Mycolicibacterium rutilum]